MLGNWGRGVHHAACCHLNCIRFLVWHENWKQFLKSHFVKGVPKGQKKKPYSCFFNIVSFAQGSFIKYVRNISQKMYISNPLICTRTCAYQWVRNISFSENFAYGLNEWPLLFIRSRTFCLVKEKKNPDLQIFIRIGKTLKSYSEFQIPS